MKNLKLYESFMSGSDMGSLPLEKAIQSSMGSGRPVLLSAAPGTGATSAVVEAANNIGCSLINVDCSFLDPSEIEKPSLRDGEWGTTPAPWLPYGNSGGPIILFLDEIDRAERQILEKLTKLAYSRSLGSYSLPKNCVVVLCIHSDDFPDSLKDRSILASL